MEVELTKKQWYAFERLLNSPERDILLVGGYGSGKSFVASFFIYFIARHYPVKVLMTRTAIRDVRNTMMDYFFMHTTPQERAEIESTHNAHTQTYDLPSGAKIFYLSSSDKNEQYKKILSYEFNIVWIEEASLVDEDVFEEIKKRVRVKKPVDFRRIILTTNPTPPDHWIYRYFIDEKRGEVIKFSTYDNIENLPDDYVKELESYPEHIRKIIMDGEFGIITDARIFNFSDKNIISKDELEKFDILELAESGRVFGGIDFGIRNTAVALAFKDLYGNLIFFYEKHFQDKSLSVIFDELKKELKEKYRLNIKLIKWCGDIAGAQRNLENMSAFDILLRKEGIFVRAEKIDVLASIEKANLLLEEKRGGRYGIMVSENCRNIIRGFYEAYEIEDNKIKKLDPFQHIADAVRYLIWHFGEVKGRKFMWKNYNLKGRVSRWASS